MVVVVVVVGNTSSSHQIKVIKISKAALNFLINLYAVTKIFMYLFYLFDITRYLNIALGIPLNKYDCLVTIYTWSNEYP